MKGIAYRSSLRALEVLRGPSVVEAAIARLPQDLASAIQFGTIITAGWYPISWYRSLTQSFTDVTAEGETLLREVVRHSVQMDMAGIYRAAFKVLSPEALFNVSARLFSSYYDTGQLAIVQSKLGYAYSKWSGCIGFDKNLWTGVFSASATYLEIAGAKSIKVHLVAGGGDADEYAELEAFWT